MLFSVRGLRWSGLSMVKGLLLVRDTVGKENLEMVGPQ
jgi:hypothetical protein